MEHAEAVDMVTRLVCRFRKVDPSQVPADADLRETLGFDSLDAAELVAALHGETGTEIDVRSVEDLRTVDAIAARLTVAAVTA